MYGPTGQTFTTTNAPRRRVQRVSSFDVFVVSHHYCVNTDSLVPITGLDDEFENCFGNVVEQNISSGDLIQERLIQSEVGEAVFQPERTIALAHMFEYLQLAERNKSHNCLVYDPRGNLRRLVTYWNYRGWLIKNRKTNDPFHPWYTGDHLVSYRR